MKEKSIKKQIQQFWKKELTSPNLIYLLGGVEQGVEEYTIFFSADDLTLYPDNWEEFLIRLEAAFNSIARIRGKKHDAQSLLKEIKARCEVYLSTRDHEELKPEIAKLEESYLSLKVKADFKDIFSKISKNSKSEPFMYPVDKNNYPQYYEIVSQPMDLTSWKKSINNFKNIKEGCDTLRLIWQNCLLFNVEGSEISETARILATETENMIQQKFGEEFADFKYLKRKTEKSDIQREEKKIKKDFDPAFVKNVLSLLLDHELALPFMKPVREVDAPGYFDCVKTPMDLSLIKNRVKINYYNSLDVFIREVDLIWENCLLYNDPKSEIASHAKTLRSYFHNLVKTPKLSIKETNSKEPKSSSPSKSMAEILRSLKEYNPYCSPFILPVDEKLAPGYSEIISRPICLMQIEENLKSRVYVDISKFVEDVRLVWLNCLQYNLPESQISQWAQKCQERFEELLGESPEFSPYRTVSKARDLPIMSIPDEVGEDPDAEDSDSKDRKNRPKINFRERKFRTILHQLVTDKIVGDLFSQSGVSSSSEEGTFNFTSIREEAKRFIDTPLEFYSFVRSKLLNLRRPPKSKTDIDLTMLAVSKLSDLFQRSFPNLPLPDGTDERSEKNQLTSFISSSCKIDRFHLIKKILQLLPGGQNVENTVTDMTCSFVNESAHRHAQDLLKQTKLPYIVTPNVYEIQQFGEICLLPRFHDANLLYPIGYSNRTVLHLTLFENRDQRSYDVPFVVVNAVSHVLIDKTTSTPIFSISLDNSVEISRSLISPLDAWNAVVGKEQQILDALGSKLKRCRAVFNRLCISPDAVPFLEPIPTDDSVGLDYYRVITSPMWLREVYERLIDGTYDNEFDFAWDIRLMLRNCWNYNAPNSSVHSAALRLGEVFETLLADWIYNIQDRAVNDLAKGEWDDWMYLKYFDAADPSSNFCRISGKKAKPSDFLSCRWCEDQYLPSTLGLTLKSRSTTWSCPRCTVALEFCEGDLRNAPKFSFQDSLYAASNFDKNVFVPATEVGLGWFQARRKGRGGLKNVFLSPLGYEVFSREEIKLQNDFEEVIDKELMAARTKEYQERNLENRRDRGKRQRRSKVQAKETVLDPALLDLFHPRHLEDGRILTGKIANFCLPTNLSWQIRVNSEGSEGNASWVPLNEVKLSGTAYFGLNVPEVVSRIEGLPNASRCENYTFKTAENMKSQIQSDLEQHQLKVQNLTSAAENVADLLLKQRWEWKAANDSKIHELNDISSFFSLENNLSEFKPLLFESVAQESMDIIFVIWDFINSTADVTGIGNVSLSELATSFTPPQSILSTIGQCIYDDICSGLTDHLLSDMALGRDLPRTEWQEFLITHPVNSITWPKIAEFVLLSFSLPLNVDQMRLLLNTTLFGESLLQLKAFTLFSNHPEIVSILEVPGVRILYDELLEKVLLNSTDAQLLESSREQFQDLIDQFLIKVKSADGGEDARTTISVFSQWCSQLMERLGSSSTEDPPVSNVDRLALPAAWGSYSMRFYGFQSHDFNLYLNFVPEYSSPYQARLKFLSWLEKTLFLLGSNDPESWTTRDRILVAVTLVDYCRCTAKCLKGLLEWQASSSQSLENLSDNDLLFECDSNKLIVPKDAKCIFTGISFDQLPDANQWAVVSSDLYSSFKVPVLELNSDSKHSTRYSGFALRPILQSMIRCRDNSRKDQAKYEVVMTKAFEDLTVGKFETCDFTTNYLGTQCIGIDSFGNSIWLLRSQEKSTLFSIDSNGRSFNPEKLSVTEPCFLGRSKQGIWFYHHADAISTLLKQFSVLSPEMTLRLTERYLSTKSKFTDSLSIQPTQKIWLDRKLYLEKWASTASLYTGASDAHRCRQIEMQYARCGEARMNVYYSDFYSKDCSIRDPSAKRIADYQTLGSLDFNPIKGWQNDGLKRIACNTVATRIHSDPTIALWVVQNLARNKLLKKVKSLSEIVPSDEALEKSKEAPDESSQKVIPNLEANPTIGLTLTDYINNRLREAQTIPTKTKAILQIHPADDSILRVYNSGKEAAQSLSVSQSGISLCLNGLKSESYGFKWKWYEGPPIDFDSIQNLQLPLSEVRSLQIMRGKPIGQAQEVIERPLESKAVPTLNTDAPKTADSSFSFPPVTIVRNQPHIVTSTKTTSSKLIKLKSEIFCILYSFPEKALKWPELDAASENLIQSAGDSAYNNVLSVSASVQAVARENGHIVDINKMAEKASRKARRRLRRKLAVEIFTKAVQSAASPSELLNQVIVLETAIPATLTYVYNRGGLPVTASTAAEVGWRLFSLDRSIAYDEINGIEHAAVSCAVKLRVCYSPRCLLSGNCTRYLSHSGKCALGAASFSRLPDQYQIAPPNEGFGLQSSSVTHSSTQEIHRKVTVPPPAVKSHPRVVEEYLPRLASYLSKEGVDIENINPWIPPSSEIANSQWI